MKHWRILTAITVATATLGGCETAEPGGQLMIDPLVARQIDYSVDWQVDLAVPAGSELVYTELLGDRLVTVERGNIVTVLDANNGSVLWRHQVARRAQQLSRPQRAGDRLVITSQRRAYLVDIDTGDQEIMELNRLSNGTPVVTEGLMIHASPGGALYAQELDTGLVAWEFQVEGGFASLPTLAGGRLFVSDVRGNLWCLNPGSGQVQRRVWDRAFPEPIRARPAADERMVYVAGLDQSLYGLLLSNGRRQWREYTRAPLVEAPFLVGDVLLQNVPEEAMLALDPEEGEVLWRAAELAGAAPLQLRGTTLDFFRAGELLHVDVREGAIVERTSMGRVDHVLSSSREGGELYLIRLNGRILKASPR